MLEATIWNPLIIVNYRHCWLIIIINCSAAVSSKDGIGMPAYQREDKTHLPVFGLFYSSLPLLFFLFQNKPFRFLVGKKEGIEKK